MLEWQTYCCVLDVIKKLKDIMAKKNQAEETTTISDTNSKTNKKGRKKASNEDKLKNEVAQLTEQLDESKDKFLRLFAEFDNYKKRTIREKLDLMKSAAQDTMSGVLPVLDDFERAKQSHDDDDSDENFSDGVLLVYNKLNSVLNSMGLSVMETNGEIFDPELHEAITEIPAPSKDMKGKIIDTIERGYMLKDKIIRHAKVVVGK
jgi:molecular chaperone GrpE